MTQHAPEADMKEIRRKTDTERRVQGYDVHQIVAIIIEMEDESVGLREISTELLEALMSLRFAVSMGPLDIAASYGPDAHPDIAINTAARIADTAIAKATGGDTI